MNSCHQWGLCKVNAVNPSWAKKRGELEKDFRMFFSPTETRHAPNINRKVLDMTPVTKLMKFQSVLDIIDEAHNQFIPEIRETHSSSHILLNFIYSCVGGNLTC